MRKESPPRTTMTVLRLGEWFLVSKTNEIFHANDLPVSEYILQERIQDYLIEKKKKEFSASVMHRQN
ncbi:hypothetical protein HCB46_08975 [Listeria ivanovii]|uniref:hypothetical protein n=1 Tax=Listeria ivanovii TaxID=1638 RepID=UPI0016292BDB|nr:hypothetical protein [Listeria ivanovii]MBC2255600.1 hypothetical protein [Listeria ivanovii]